MLRHLIHTFNVMGEAYNKYFGESQLIVFVILALAALFWLERRQRQRDLLFTYPAILIALIVNPAFVVIFTRIIDYHRYVRLIWALFIPVLIAIAAQLLLEKARAEKGRTATMVLAAVLALSVILTGDFMYWNEKFTSRDNWHKLPVDTILVCDTLRTLSPEPAEVRIAVPRTLEVSIRQYDASLKMAYGRDGSNASGYPISETVALRDLINKPVVPLGEAGPLLAQFAIDYLVLHQDSVIESPVEGTEKSPVQLAVAAQPGDYVIYRVNR
jgi:hypothetical protein